MEYYVELPEVWVTEFLEDDQDCAGYWVSSLTQSWQKGYADNCTVPWTNYVDVVRRLRLQSEKKIVVDVDMLFNEPSIAATIARELFGVGCNTIVVESKRFPKVNSLTPDGMVLSTPEEFTRLLNKVKTTVPELELIARNEYLAKTRDVDMACRVSKRSINAGADGVVIHWGGDSNTNLLKETLAVLKADNVLTGIIPTKYLNQVVGGEFDGLADFSILGNICSSFIRHAFSGQTVSSLLETPCVFEPILERVKSHEPPGQKTLIVLGGKQNEQGRYLLADPGGTERFTDFLGEYFSIILVVGGDAEIDTNTIGGNVHIARVEDSVGEVHSLTSAVDLLNTENATVVYADIDEEGLAHLGAPGMLFRGDTFAGVMNVKSDLLLAMASTADPTASMMNIGMQNGVGSTLID